MAAVLNDRDVFLQAATPRTAASSLPSNVTVTGNVTGTLNGQPVQDVIDAAFIGGGTSNFFTQGASDPSAGFGANGDAYWQTTSKVMFFKISGAWVAGGTISASQITTGTLAAARIAANTITATMMSVTTLSAVSSNLGSVTAGSIAGSADIDILGAARFNGSTNSEGVIYAGEFNASRSRSGGLRSYAGIGGWGVSGVANTSGSSSIGVNGSATGGTGVRGTASLSGGTGVVAEAISSSGTALQVNGKMQITSTSLVTNLNADLLDSKQGTSYCQLVVPNTGSCTVSGSGFNLISTVANVQVRGNNSNGLIIESFSDERLKQDIENETLGLDFVNQLNPVTFRIKRATEIKYHGFIGQHMETVMGGLSDDSICRSLEDGMISSDYISLIAPLVKAVQELTAKANDLEAPLVKSIQELTTKVNDLETQLLSIPNV